MHRCWAWVRLFIVFLIAGPGLAGIVLAQTLTLATSRGPVSLLIYVADANGYFRDEGVDVKLADCSSGRNCASMLQNGAAHLATASELVVATDTLVHPDLAIVGTVSTSSHQIKLIGRRSAGVSVPEQLRAKRIGVPLGTSAHYFFSTWQLFHNIDSSQLTLVGLPPSELENAIRQQSVDAIVIWEPIATNALLALGSDGTTLPNPRVYTQHFVLVSRRAQLGQKGEPVKALLKGLLAAQRFIAKDQIASARILADRLSISQAVALAQMKEHDYRVRLDQTMVSTMASQLRWAAQEQIAKPEIKAVNPLRLIEAEPLRSLAPGAVTVNQ